jgi:hypothetical protein
MGNRYKAKGWDLDFQHPLRPTFKNSPDIHTLMFVAGADFHAVLDTALRDYIRSTNHPAGDPNFQKQVFLEAARQTSLGMPATGKDVLAAIKGEALPAIVVSATATKAALPTLSPVQNPPTADKIPDAGNLAPKKPPVVLDFGPDPQTEAEAPKPSQRDKWLKQNQAASK